MAGQQREVICHMVCTTEEEKETVSIFEGENFIGRNNKECNVVVRHLSVSQRHCKLTVKGKKGYITDLNSKNGVFLHQQRLPSMQEVEFNLDTDPLEISELHCKFVFDKSGLPELKNSKATRNCEDSKKNNDDETKKVVKISKPSTFKEDITEEDVSSNKSKKKEPPKKGKTLHRYLDSDSSDNQTKDEVSKNEEKTAKDPKGRKKHGKPQPTKDIKRKKEGKKQQKLEPLSERQADESDSESQKKLQKKKTTKSLEKPPIVSSNKSKPKDPKPSSKQQLREEDSNPSHRKTLSKASPFLKIPRGTRFTIIASRVEGISSPLSAIEIVQSVKTDYRICVMQDYERTFKLLYSIASGRHIVSTRWLEECEKTRQVVNFMDYLIDDPDNPGLLRRSVEKAIKGGPKIFAGLEFFLTKADFHIRRQEFFELVNICGGTNLNPRNLEYPKAKTIVIVPQEQPDNKSIVNQIRDFLNQGYRVQTIEMVLNSCLHQTLLWEPDYKLK